MFLGLFGYRGVDGEPGDQGEFGFPGRQGLTGRRGKSIFNIFLWIWDQNDEWVDIALKNVGKKMIFAFIFFWILI